MTLSERIDRHFNPIRFTKLESVELEKAQIQPLDEQDPEPYPVGFFRAKTRSGIDADQGFYCDKCHLLIQVGLLPGQIVRHCKKIERVAHPHPRMAERSVGQFFNAPQMNAATYLVPVGF